jgi:arylsulfatase A-like enzyme
MGVRTLFVILDTVRRDFLGCHGNQWVQTPNLDRLAGSGFAFDNHWVGSLPCMPARREFMTGRPNFLDRGWGPIEPFDDILPVELRKRGVFSHLATDHYHYFELGGENYHTGFNSWDFHRGQECDPWVSLVDAPAMPAHLGQMQPRNVANRTRQVEEEDFSGPRTVSAAMRWLEENRHSDNWLLQVELFDPHEPFYCPKKYRDLYGDTWDGPSFDWPAYEIVKESPEAVEHVRKCYAALLTMTDHWCGRLFQKLEALGLWEDTLIVFTTDHGTMLGEREYWMKTWMPVYPEIGHIPLVIKPPRSRGGGRIGALTQTADVMPTLLDYFGCPLPPHVTARSLRPLLENSAGAWREDIIFGYFGMAVNITDGRHLYMRNPVREDGGPLHAYTAMPIHWLNSWFPRSLYDKMEMGRYLGHTYNIPLYKIPQQGKAPRPRPGRPSFIGNHELYALPCTPESAPLQNADLEAHFAGRIIEHLKRAGAPGDHLARLGLD